MKRVINILLSAALVFTLACPASAAAQSSELDAAVAYLRQTGVMVGDQNGEMHLDRGLNRAEMAAILARMTVNQEHLMADKAFYAGQCTFTDVPEWAQVYVGYCATNYIVAGYGGGLYGSYDPVTPAAACTVMLRCLGHPETDWSYRTAVQKAVQLNLAPMESLTGAEISRGGMAILVYRTMAQLGWDTGDIPESNPTEETVNPGKPLTRNADGSINIPSDGSQYVPQAGDVIRCDDGSNYTITDVSRYDANMFASGPLGPLPEPTCDWSQFPKVELPAAEVRRSTQENGDRLYIRNLYETRRMLYTLYNAVGANPETWQNGTLATHPSGNPKVRISLTIDTDQGTESFWPWREREIVDPFNSSPCGTHCMEAWDVYKDGVFIRTEYIVLHMS